LSTVDLFFTFVKNYFTFAKNILRAFYNKMIASLQSKMIIYHRRTQKKPKIKIIAIISQSVTGLME